MWKLRSETSSICSTMWEIWRKSKACLSWSYVREAVFGQEERGLYMVGSGEALGLIDWIVEGTVDVSTGGFWM